jgi:hypothetical protein
LLWILFFLLEGYKHTRRAYNKKYLKKGRS